MTTPTTRPRPAAYLCLTAGVFVIGVALGVLFISEENAATARTIAECVTGIATIAALVRRPKDDDEALDE